MINKTLSYREKIIMIICAVMIIIYMLYIGIIRPLINRATILDGLIMDKQLMIKKEMKILQKAEIFKKTYQKFQKENKQIGSSEKVMSMILAEIENIAKGLGLTISDLKPKKVKSQNYFNRFSVSLTLTSQFTDIMHFLYKLQNVPHLFSIDEIHFDKVSRRRGSKIKTRLVLSKIFIPIKENLHN